MAALDPINALADTSPGFIWRLQTTEGNATSIHSFDDELIISNMSVWESIEALRAFIYTSAHTGVMRRRREWFEAYETRYMALWWIPPATAPRSRRQGAAGGPGPRRADAVRLHVSRAVRRARPDRRERPSADARSRSVVQVRARPATIRRS